MAAAASTLDRCRFVGRTVDARDRRLGDAGAEVDGNSGQSAAATLPPEFVLVFGGAGSLLVAVFYVPAAGALDRRGQALSTELFPLNEADEASAVLSVADNRNKLEQLLGIGNGAFADLQTGLAILGPLLPSAAAVFLSPR